MPSEAMTIFVHHRIVFICIFVHAAKTGLDAFQPEILTTQTYLLSTVHILFTFGVLLVSDVPEI